MITIQSFLFQSIPEAIVYSAFTIALAGLLVKDNKFKTVFAGFIIACITVVLWYIELPFFGRFFIQMPILWTVFYFIYRYPYYKVMITSTVGIGIMMIAETLSTEIILLVADISFEQIIASNTLRIIVPSGGYLLLIAATWVINNYKWSLFGNKTLNDKEAKVVNKKVDIYILVLTIQILLVIVYNLSYVGGYFQQSKLMFQIMIFSIVILSFILLFFVQYIIALSEKAGELEAQKAYIKHVNDLFVTIRGQRHDFVNHIQVLQSFAVLQRYDMLKDYINTLTEEVKEIGKIIIPGNATLSALLQTKSVIFKTYNISLNINIVADINKTQIDMIDQVKLLGNLLDNAKEAIIAHNVETSMRNVSLDIELLNGQISIKVRNCRPLLTDEQLERIFTAGYTTKTNHTGIGLAVVKQIVDKYNGQIAVSSSETEGTVFVIVFPVLKDGEADENISACYSD